MKVSSIHSLEWDKFRTSVDKIKSLDDIVLICRNINVDNLEIFEKLLLINDEKEKYISRIGDIYKKQEIIDTNKKFEIKNNKEINIDVYYNMNSIENILNLSVDEFKNFIEKGNTVDQNNNLLNLIITEIKECETKIYELNTKIIDFTNEKDEKGKKWSYLYEIYRKLIETVENKTENVENKTEIIEKIENFENKIDNIEIKKEKKIKIKIKKELNTTNEILSEKINVNDKELLDDSISKEVLKKKVTKKLTKKNDIIKEDSIVKNNIIKEDSIVKNNIIKEDSIVKNDIIKEDSVVKNDVPEKIKKVKKISKNDKN